MLKKAICFVAATLLLSNVVFSQDKGKSRVSFDLGYAIPDGGGGLVLYVEPASNVTDNIRLGMRLGLALLAKNIETTGDTVEADLGANTSYLGTFDYIFDTGTGFVPYIGLGLGYYRFANINFESNDTSDSFILDASGKFGGMIRTGFESGKFRFGVDYNIVPDSDLKDVNGSNIGSFKNNYLGINLGFFIGGGKWGR
jgi:outer membrane protein X